MTQKRKKVILIVDDEPDICMLLEDDLAEAGYQIFSAHSGNEAYQIIKNQEIDAVLTDVRMPKVNGLLLAKFINSKSTVPIVMMSGYPIGDVEKELDDLKIHSFLTKPFDKNKVLTVLESVFNKSD